MSFKTRIPRAMFHFLYPGIRLKRWMFLLLMGLVVISAGLAGVVGEATAHRNFHIKPLQKVERLVRNYVRSLRPLDLWLIVGGGFAVIFAMRRGYYAMLAVIMPSGERRFIRLAYERARRKRGPKIVAIGGGTGLPNLLLGLKEYTDNLTAVVTVADDGGSSGRLRQQYKIPPPGDLRNCLVALADAEPLMGRLFQHRFAGKGELKGHTFGNIFLTALAEVSGDFSRALAESSRVLAVRGRVVPVTLDMVQLIARLKNGRTVRGESRIASAGSPVDRVQLQPARPRANPEAVKALGRADIIVFGPGSLFTSVVPNLLVPEIREAINGTQALKIYVCNIMTEPGETEDFSVADHLETIAKYLGDGGMDAVVVNSEPPPARLLEKYRREHAQQVTVDTDRVNAMGVRVISGKVLAARSDFIRHDSAKLSATLIKYAVI